MTIATDTVPSTAGPRQWAGLALLGASSLLISIDVFVLMLALPHLSKALGASATEQLWVLDIYAFMIAGFLITMGNVGDRIGRKRLLLIGSAAFAVASVVAAFSVSPIMLIIARAFLGIAGATMAPSTLALISGMFRDAKQRGLAIGIWLVCFIGGAAIGPVVGGLMLELFWWGAAFLLGVPVMVLVLALGPFLLTESADPHRRAIDLPSVALSLGAILPVIWGMKELAAHGFAAPPVVALVLGIGLGVVFVVRQRRLDHPLIDLALFRRRSFTVAVASMALATVLGSIMFFVIQYLQLVAGLSPLLAGVATLPAVASSIAGFLIAPILARRIRPARLIAAGMVVTSAGLLTLAMADSVPAVVVGYSLFQIGCGPLVTLSTGLVLGSAPPERAGAASGLNESSSELGYAVGIAVMGTAALAVYRAGLGGLPALDPADEATVREGIVGATEVASSIPDGAAVLEVARDAFVQGMHIVAGVLVVVAVAIGLANLRFQRHVPPLGQEEDAGHG